MDGFDFFPANTQPSQTSATGLGHTSAPRAGLEAAAVEAETACRHGLPTVEARHVMNNMSYNSFCHFHN